MSEIENVVIGVDVGGTNTKMGIVNQHGEITAFRRIPTDARGNDPAGFLARFSAAIDEMIASLGGQPVGGIGVSMHGELDADARGPIIAGNTPALRNFDMRGYLEARYQFPVKIYNDLTAHTLGEYHFGAGQGVPRFMCLAIGTGLGAGVIVDGKPLIIDGGNSGNTGLIILDPDGPADANGIRGSAEALCGVRGIERLARQFYGRDVLAHEVIAAASTGDDSQATAIMRQVGMYLGQTLASLSVIFYPHRIALTGGTVAAGQVLLEACQEQFEVLVGRFFSEVSANTKGYFKVPEIVLGTQGSETGVLGAVVDFLPLGHASI